jgi:hypothetical protein
VLSSPSKQHVLADTATLAAHTAGCASKNGSLDVQAAIRCVYARHGAFRAMHQYHCWPGTAPVMACHAHTKQLASAETQYVLKQSHHRHSVALARACVFLTQPHLCCVQGTQGFRRSLMTYMQMPGKSKCVLATAVHVSVSSSTALPTAATRTAADREHRPAPPPPPYHPANFVSTWWQCVSTPALVVSARHATGPASFTHQQPDQV